MASNWKVRYQYSRVKSFPKIITLNRKNCCLIAGSRDWQHVPNCNLLETIKIMPPQIRKYTITENSTGLPKDIHTSWKKSSTFWKGGRWPLLAYIIQKTNTEDENKEHTWLYSNDALDSFINSQMLHFCFLCKTAVSLFWDGQSDSFSTGKGHHGLGATTNNEDVRQTSGKGVTSSILDMHNVVRACKVKREALRTVHLKLARPI